MENRKTKTLYFPHVIAGNKLAGEEIPYNAINGGMKPLSDFNINPNRFMGGNCSKAIGFMKEYGFYACPHYEQRRIIAFYIHDPEQMTPKGREVLEKMYPDYKIIYERLTDDITKPLQLDIVKKRAELLDKIEEKGMKEEYVFNASVDELENVLAALDSGKSDKKVIIEKAVEVVEESPSIKHLKNRPKDIKAAKEEPEIKITKRTGNKEGK